MVAVTKTIPVPVIAAVGRSSFHSAHPRDKSPFRKIFPQQLLGQTMRGVVENSGLYSTDFKYVEVGCTGGGTQHTNVGVRAALEAFGASNPNMFTETGDSSCASSLKKAINAAMFVMSGRPEAKFVLVGGVEHQADGHAPAGRVARYLTNHPLGYIKDVIGTIAAGFAFGKDPVRMGQYIFSKTTPPDSAIPQMLESGDYIVKIRGYTIDDLNEYAQLSSARTVTAAAEGLFEPEIIPIDMGKDGWVKRDLIREDSTELGMKNLKPVIPGGYHHAGNSSQFGIGASALVIADEEAALKRGITPLARIVDWEVGGMGLDIGQLLGPVPAIRGLLNKTGLKVSEIDHWEVNEAFASVVKVTQDEFDIPIEKLNPQGGAITLTHPFGATGARLIAHATLELKRTNKRYAIITLCVAQGLYAAMLIENYDYYKKAKIEQTSPQNNYAGICG